MSTIFLKYEFELEHIPGSPKKEHIVDSADRVAWKAVEYKQAVSSPSMLYCIC